MYEKVGRTSQPAAAGMNMAVCEAKLSIDWSSMESVIHTAPRLDVLAVIGIMTQEPVASVGFIFKAPVPVVILHMHVLKHTRAHIFCSNVATTCCEDRRESVSTRVPNGSSLAPAANAWSD